MLYGESLMKYMGRCENDCIAHDACRRPGVAIQPPAEPQHAPAHGHQRVLDDDRRPAPAAVARRPDLCEGGRVIEPHPILVYIMENHYGDRK